MKIEDLNLVYRLRKETKDERNFKDNPSIIIVQFKTRETRNSISKIAKKHTNLLSKSWIQHHTSLLH